MAIFKFLFVLPLPVDSHYRHKIPKHKAVICFVFIKRARTWFFAGPRLGKFGLRLWGTGEGWTEKP